MDEYPSLPLAAGPPPQERADAARNRARVLAAAELLFAERDPGTVTMDEIAKAAGIGRGTLYRRYPDRASIARALLDEHERVLQEKVLRGPPPLGPSESPRSQPSPADRLAAFYQASAEFLEAHGHLLLGAEAGIARYGTGAYAFWRLHVTHLARQAGVHDPDALADLLLSPLTPELFTHQRQNGVSLIRIIEALRKIAYGVLPGS
ncbi:TetR/AcrR family transcriptional regulator [Streptomyces chartreusis]